MQPSSPISSFQLNQDPQSPPVPNILRSRHKTTQETNSHKVRQFSIHPKEIIIDAHQYNQQYPSHKDKHIQNHQGIRSEIDACLNAVSKVYEEQSKRKSSHTLKEINLNSNEPLFSKNSIHRVDARLILKYIGTLDQQYRLENRLHKLDIIAQTRLKPTQPARRNPQERFASVEKARGQSKKSFINLTVSNKKEKRQQSPSKKTVNASHHAPSTNHSPHRTLLTTTPQHIASTASKGKISQDFKYCISCEKQILSCNIDYHQTHQCKQLEEIYKLSFADIRIFINNKINKFRQQIEEKLNHLRSIQSMNQKEFPKINLKDQICENVIKSIQVYLRSESKDATGSYKAFNEALKNDFFQCIALTEKLNYFSKILFSLKQHTPLHNKEDTAEKGLSNECRVVVNGVSHFDPVSE